MPYKNKADLIARWKQWYKERKEEFNSKHMEYYRVRIDTASSNLKEKQNLRRQND